MPAELNVGKVSDYNEGTLRTFLKLGWDVAVVNWKGEFYAFRNVCTHSAFSFDYTDLTEDGLLECAGHGAVFQPQTGEALSGPTSKPLPTYKVRVDGDDVYVYEP